MRGSDSDMMMAVVLLLLLMQACMSSILSCTLSHHAAWIVLLSTVARCSKRSWYRYPRVGGLWSLISDDTVNLAVKEHTLMAACRMRMDDFGELVDRLAPYLPSGDRAVPYRQAVAAVLFRLAHNASVWVVSEEFGLGPSTVVQLTQIICHALATDLGEEFLRLPSDVSQVMGEFSQLCGLPNVVGAMDGKIFQLDRAPPQRRWRPATFWCARKAQYGLNVMGVVDARGRFMFGNARYPGRTHDATVFRNSDLYSALVRGELWGGGGDALQGGFRPVLVVDSGYPLLPFTLKRYHKRRSAGTTDENNFDLAVSRGRNPVERSWGRVAQRWHICRKLPVAIESAPDVVMACLVLHNFIERHGEIDLGYEGEVYIDDEEEGAPEVPTEGRLKRQGKQQRDDLFRWYCAHG